ncbi:adenylate/guanylate cyclase domain-containing protein [Lewinella sp. LCG006]|uniref:adenylate/guanylate cyclase domain-containing protein n=1 Tax=Lewinella sp. LCG006 TaxID=3231911 RepID=UPI0034607E55
MRFLLLLSTLLSFSAVGQESTDETAIIDSLRLVVKSAKNDTLRINALKKWDNIIYRYDPELDLNLNLKIDSIASIHLEKNLAANYRDFYAKSKGFATGNLGLIYNSLGKNTIALNYLNESLRIKQTLGDETAAARVLNNIGSIYHEQGLHAKAIEYYTNALRIHEIQGNTKGKAGALNNIAIIHRHQGNFNTALKYYKRSLSLKLADKDSIAIAVAYLNIGALYNEIDSLELANRYTLKSLNISDQIKNDRYIALAYVNLGSIYHSKNKLQEAEEYYIKGFLIQESINDGKMLAETAAYLSEIYFEQGNYAKALELGNKALGLSYENDVVKVSEQASSVLYKVHQKLGNYEKAFEMLQRNTQLNEQINSEENQKAAIRQQFKYEYENKAALAEAEQKRKDQVARKDAERKNIIIWSGALGLLMLLVFAVFVFNRLRVTKKQKAIIEKQKRKVDQAYAALDSEKEKSDSLLLNILPKEVAEELKEKGSADAKNIDSATVLFTDFKGFTTLSEQLSAEELVEEINTCFSAFDHIMEKYQIEKIKTIGDAYMAAGGIPIPNETHALDVVNAALEIQTFMLEYAEDKKQKGAPYFEIRIGVHTGPVVAGIVGIKKFQYDIWGDTVNTASRMESSGEVGKINVSESTYGIVKGSKEYTFESRGKIEAKGKGLLEMYFVEKK